MAPGAMGDGTAEPTCPSCGVVVAANTQACAVCGRRVTAPFTASNPVLEAPTWASLSPVEPAAPATAWPASAELPTRIVGPAVTSAPPSGMAALAAVPRPPRATRVPVRRGALTGLAAVCLAAFLAGGVYWAYASLIPTPSQTSLARYFPSTTIVYAAVDLQSAQAGQKKDVQSLMSGPLGANFFNSAGLDWTTDVQSWAGPMVAFGVYASLPGAYGTTAARSALDAVGMTVVLQSRDDGAATSAVQKALSHSQTNGDQYTQTGYGGYSVYVPTADSGASQVFATGRGIVLLANSEAAAHTAIDRGNGSGDSLSGDSTFQQAVGKLPTARFGTLYYNASSLNDPTGLGMSGLNLPFVGTYPMGAGALEWTSAGMRVNLGMTPTHGGVPGAGLSGDTTSLAAMVPADAISYIGVANLGALEGALSDLLSTGQPAGGTQDVLQSVFRVPSSAPGAQVPSASFVEPSGHAQAGELPDSVVLLREPSQAAAETLMAATADQQHWTRQDTTVAGIPAATYTSATSSVGSSGAQQVVEAYVSGVLVLASAPTGLENVVAVTQGRMQSLGQGGSFRRLAAIAPMGAAATVFGTTGILVPLFSSPSAPDGSSRASGSESLATLTWTASSLQLTYDAILP
jgi:Protein of unknown function (DUF3352)